MIKYVFLFLFFSVSIIGAEIECEFEEVYMDGSVQNGFLLVKGDHFRYQYNKKTLYTIIKNPRGAFIINRSNPDDIQSLFDPLIDKLGDIYKNFPYIEHDYEFKDFKVKLNFNKNDLFLKRLSVISPKLNLSIYFKECLNQNISINYFMESKYIEYTKFYKN